MPTTGQNNAITAIIKGDISDLEKAIKDAEKLLADYAKQTEKIGRELKQSEKHTTSLRNSLAKLNNAYKRGEKSQEQFAKESDKLNSQILDSSKVTENLQQELDTLQDKSIAASNSLENLGHSTNQYVSSAQDTTRATNRMNQGLTRFNHSTGSANNVMQSFGQTIQDAPYGIRGVANNITFLAESFGDLTSQTGSTRGAFKALAASLTGPTGIILGISLVTSLLVAYGDEIKRAISGVSKLTLATSKFVSEAQAEIIKLQTLFEIAKGVNSTKRQQKKAIEALNDEYGEYLPKLTQENIKTQEVATAVAALNKQLLLQAKLRGVEDLITERTKKYAKEEATLRDLIKTRKDEVRQLAKEEGFDLGDDILSNQKFLTFVTSTKDEVQELAEGMRKFESAKSSIAGGFSIPEIVESVGSLKQLNRELEETQKEAKDATSSLIGIQKALLKEKFSIDIDKVNVEESKSEIQDEINKISKDGGVRLPVTPVLTFGSSEANITPAFEDKEFSVDIINKGLVDQISQISSKALGLVNTLRGTVVPAIHSMFGALGNELVKMFNIQSSIIGSFVSVIIQSLAQMAAKLISSKIIQAVIGKATIEIQRAKATAAAITAATQTAAAIPFGLFALPGFISAAVGGVNAAFAGLASFAQGGIVQGGSFVGDKVPIMVNSGEMILNNRQQSNLFDLLDARMSNLSNSNELKIAVEGKIKGRDIIISEKRTQEALNRI